MLGWWTIGRAQALGAAAAIAVFLLWPFQGGSTRPVDIAFAAAAWAAGVCGGSILVITLADMVRRRRGVRMRPVRGFDLSFAAALLALCAVALESLAGAAGYVP